VGRSSLALVVSLLAACAARPPGASTEGPRANPSLAGPSSSVEDAGAATVRACVRGAKDVAPCSEDCDRGIASACAILASRVERGEGVAKDPTRAASLHERACELGDAASCVVAARMHAGGLGVPPNRARQMELLVAACNLGDAFACVTPAKAFATGAGVPRDERRAAELAARACAGGIESACEAGPDGGP
jgi:hypothetical protein